MLLTRRAEHCTKSLVIHHPMAMIAAPNNSSSNALPFDRVICRCGADFAEAPDGRTALAQQGCAAAAQQVRATEFGYWIFERKPKPMRLI
jgi:hypothetical protein